MKRFVTLFALTVVFMSSTMAQTPVTVPLINKSDWKIEAGNPAITWFGTGNADRGGTYNPKTDHVVVVPRTGTPQGIILDAASGVEVGKLDFTGVAGGTFPTNEVVITPDGQIFICNLSAAPATGAVKVYYWADEAAKPVEAFNATVPEGARYGDGMGIAGNGTNITIYLSGSSNNDRILVLKWDAATKKLSNSGYLVPEATKHRARYGIAPVSGKTQAWINSPGNKLALIDTNTGTILNEVDPAEATLGLGDLAYFSFSNKNYVVSGPNFDGTPAPMDFWVIDVTDPAKGKLVAKIEGVVKNANTNATGFVAWDSKRGNIITSSTNNHIASYPFVIKTAREDDDAIASGFRLNGNFPNPFNPTTNISFDLASASQVQISVLDITGREVMNTPTQFYPAGVAHNFQLNVSNLPSGQYVYRVMMQSANNSYIRSGVMTLLK